jgi:hypothetical protein
MTALQAGILGAAVWGPGLEGWAASRPILAGTLPYEPRPSPAPAPAILPATERRRTSPVARLALVVAQEAAAASGLPPGSLRSIFASSNGDGVVVGSILDALTTIGAADRPVSPTQFHNSVHNAAAGYWSIANGSAQPATCLGLHDDTWAAALLKAMAEVVADGEPVLLCAYDHPLPAPLDAKRPTLASFGLGLVLAPPGIGTPLAQLALRYDAMVEVPPPVPRLEALRGLAAGNAAARGLPLLEALARGEADSHRLPYQDGCLTVSLAP